MRILVGKVFGIGNAVMAIPMIKALQYKPDTVVDILVGSKPDDVGAYDIMSRVVTHPGKLYVDNALEHDYDVAIMSIPFDGRWENGVHFRAKRVMDGRTRPDPSTTGLVSWKEHESEYQMENARELGFRDYSPKCSFMKRHGHEYGKSDKIYVGMGYKKDAAGFWKVKHWGNENYASLINMILDRYPSKTVITTGDVGDMQLSIGPVSRLVSNQRFKFRMSSIDDALISMCDCDMYIGNDTGMMHVASSLGLDVLAMFFIPGSATKSSPLKVKESQKIELLIGYSDEGREIWTPEKVFEHVKEMIDDQ